MTNELLNWFIINKILKKDSEYYFLKSKNLSECQDEIEKLNNFCSNIFKEVLEFRKSKTKLKMAYFESYPKLLEENLKKGYFGELFIGYLIEKIPFFSMKWEPAIFGFHHHYLAFNELERALVNGSPIRKIFGNTGEDVVSFYLDIENNKLKWLNCESKFRLIIDRSTINGAMKKINEKKISPIRLEQVTEICMFEKREKIVDFLSSIYPNDISKLERVDLVFVIYQDVDWKNDSKCFDSKAPKLNYKGNFNFIAVETQISELNSLFLKIMGA